MIIGVLQSNICLGGQKFKKKVNQIDNCLIKICHEINIGYTPLTPRNMLNVL